MRPQGSSAPLGSAALRSAHLTVVGTGQGSVPTADILTELPELGRQITAGAFTVSARAIPLSQVEHIWTASAGATQRVVLTPVPSSRPCALQAGPR